MRRARVGIAVCASLLLAAHGVALGAHLKLQAEHISVAAAEALRRAERELERHPDNARAAYLGATMLVTLGDARRAREWVGQALSIEPDDFLVLYNAACTHAQLGDFDAGVELLERALPSAFEETRSWLRLDSDLDPLRRHPRFQALLARLECEP